jgi:AraC-like DNA-binding protein
MNCAKNKKKHSPLPALAFGTSRAVIDTHVHLMEEKLQRLANGMQQYDTLSRHGTFQHASSIINVNGMRIGATSSTPTRVRIQKTNSLMLMVPFHGSGHYEMGGETLTWSAGKHAVLLPNQPFTGESMERSSLVLLLDEIRLAATLDAMLGLPSGSITHLDSDRPRVLNMNYGKLSFDAIFRQQAHFLNVFSESPALLNNTGIDDGIYRSVVLLLNFKLFSNQADAFENKSPRAEALDPVCHFIMAHLNENITLTELERISFMSKRKLQYSFLNKFNCTPMQWVRMRRLENAQNILLHTQIGTPISRVAALCGFNNTTTFSTYYKLHFGELPSATLLRSLG